MAAILVSLSVHIDSKQVVPWTILPVTDSDDSVEQLCKRVFTGEMEGIRGLEGKNPIGLELRPKKKICVFTVTCEKNLGSVVRH